MGFLIIFFTNFKILPRPAPYTLILGGSLLRVAHLCLAINVLPFGRFTCTGHSFFTIIILFCGCIFFRWLIFNLFSWVIYTLYYLHFFYFNTFFYEGERKGSKDVVINYPKRLSDRVANRSRRDKNHPFQFLWLLPIISLSFFICFISLKY